MSSHSHSSASDSTFDYWRYINISLTLTLTLTSYRINLNFSVILSNTKSSIMQFLGESRASQVVILQEMRMQFLYIVHCRNMTLNVCRELRPDQIMLFSHKTTPHWLLTWRTLWTSSVLPTTPFFHVSSCLCRFMLTIDSGGATLWQSSANALPVCCHALPVALPVF